MRRAISTLFIVTLSLFFGGCSDPQELDAEPPPVRPVKLLTVGQSDDSIMRSFPAEVVAHQGSYLAFRVSGELIEFPVLAGAEVKKGQLLAKLDPEDFQLQYDERKARYDLAMSQLQRIQALFDKNIASQAELDQAIANARVAESAFNIAQTNLENSQLRAPFSGTVAKVFVKNFENIQAKQNILRLETRDLMDVEIQVPEKLVARVNKDTLYQPTVVFDGFPNKAYKLRIKEYDTQADPATLTYKVVFSLPLPTDFNLLAGMTGHVYIDISKITKNTKAWHKLPAEAVFSDPQQDTVSNSYVWVYNADTGMVSKRAVEVGQLHRDGIEVRSGIESGEQVVAAGVHYLQEGMKVRPWHKERGL